MKRPALILSAAALDAILGDPEPLPHPIRAMGWAISRGESLLLRETGPPARQFVAGALLAVSLVALSAFATREAIRFTRRIHPRLGSAVEVLLAGTTLAARNLHDEASSVIAALEAGDLPRARLRLARIVGRDTAHLDKSAICRAVIETLAESACDGVLAPLLFLTLGGAPLAMAFKAASTLDSMIGHRTPRFLFFGRASARLDDAANFIPARVAAALILLLSGRLDPTSLHLYRRDCRQHASPNAGHPEAATAAALRIQLGGPSTYDGQPHSAPLLCAGLSHPTVTDARRALHLVVRVSLAASLGAACLALACKTLFPRRNPRRNTRKNASGNPCQRSLE